LVDRDYFKPQAEAFPQALVAFANSPHEGRCVLCADVLLDSILVKVLNSYSNALDSRPLIIGGCVDSGRPYMSPIRRLTMSGSHYASSQDILRLDVLDALKACCVTRTGSGSVVLRPEYVSVSLYTGHTLLECRQTAVWTSRRKYLYLIMHCSLQSIDPARLPGSKRSSVSHLAFKQCEEDSRLLVNNFA